MSAEASPLISIPPRDLAHFAWADAPPVRKIIAALEAAAPGGSRFVGGCVRDSLLGERPKDIDIATVLPPKDVIRALNRAGLKGAPTGIDHGTVTGIADHVGIEITTLRADISTDGRRATVAFTDDWGVDAGRRDFRLNAIYLTADRLLFDPVDGVEDARAGRVRFIGSPEDRIREDYLRILRFFRFSARFAKSFDADGLAASAKLKDGIAHLSAERIGDEFTKILALPRAASAVEAMEETGVLAAVWGAPANLGIFRQLKDIGPTAPAPLGLAALWGAAGEGIDSALRLSNADAARRRTAFDGAALISAGIAEKDARARLYRLSDHVWRDAALLARAQSDNPDDPRWKKLAALPDSWPAPRFPFTGKDVVAEGVAKGPLVSKVLRAAEETWIGEDFPDEHRAREILRETVAALA